MRLNRPFRNNEKALGKSEAFRADLYIRSQLTFSKCQGAELSHDSAGESWVDDQGDAESDAVCVVSDPCLARLIEVWPALAEDVKGEMLKLAGLQPNDVDDVTVGELPLDGLCGL